MLQIDWGNTFVIYIPRSYLTLDSGTLYRMNTVTFREDLKALEASFAGMPFPRTHDHNPEVTISGITYFRAINILPPYSVEFEDGAYSVILEGSNNNIWDIASGILIQNQVQVIPTNTAGGQIVTVLSGSGVTEQDKLDIADRVWDEQNAEHLSVGSVGKKLNDGSTASADWTETERAYILATLAETRGWAEIAASNTEGLVSGQDWTPEERDTILDGIMEAKGWARISAENTES